MTTVSTTREVSALSPRRTLAEMLDDRRVLSFLFMLPAVGILLVFLA